MRSTDNRRRDHAVAIWLFLCCGLVFAMVVLGGFTRLSGSGLSMAEWRPIMGSIPPLSEAEWQRVFDIYRQTPEFVKVNAHFDVEDFKGIFWLEYLHRLLGRFIGFAFALPLAWFAIKDHITLRQLPWYLLLLALGGAQAFIGKIMVASGQVDAPAVSHYRLTAHLAAAFLVYALMFWTAMNRLHGPPQAPSHPAAGRSAMLTGLIGVTILSGGFVAGLKAGKIYNTFPKMGETWLPSGLNALTPAWRNLFDNPATVQFDHRLLALATFTLILLFGLALWRRALDPRARRATFFVMSTVLLQVTLGVLTLVLNVPVLLAVLHQATGLLLLTSALYLTHALRHTAAESAPVSAGAADPAAQ